MIWTAIALAALLAGLMSVARPGDGADEGRGPGWALLRFGGAVGLLALGVVSALEGAVWGALAGVAAGAALGFDLPNVVRPRLARLGRRLVPPAGSFRNAA